MTTNEEIKRNAKPETRKPRGENTICSPPATGRPGEPQVKLNQFFDKMLPAFIKIVKPSVPYVVYLMKIREMVS